MHENVNAPVEKDILLIKFCKQKSRLKPTFLALVLNLVPSPGTRNKLPVSSVLKFSERCRALTSLT